MNKIATVQKVTHTGNNGGYNFWEVELSGGDKGGISGKKSECYVKEGDLVEYTMDTYKNGSPKINVENKNEYVKGSENQQSLPSQSAPTKPQADVQTYIIRQSSLERALKMFELNDAKPELHTVCVAAEALTNYVLTGEFPRKIIRNNVTNQPVQNPEEVDELPF